MVDSLHDIINRVSPHYASRVKKKAAGDIDQVSDFQTKLVYNSSTETLEPVYFWILDFMEDMGLKVEKIFDNFESSPGSGHFSEMGQRASVMQQNASKIMQDIGVITKGMITNLYDLKEFNSRLQVYEDYKSKDKDKKEGALLSLKQIWMDKVDIQKGNSSIKALALGQGGFQLLLDAFLAVKDESLKGPDGKIIEVNDRLKRILKSRIQDFNIWLSLSEKELRNRYKMQKTYLKSQIDNLKLYSRWARPYLKAAEELRNAEFGNSGKGAALVKAFNTMLLEVTLLGLSSLNAEGAAKAGDLPEQFAEERFLKTVRKYNSCLVVDLYFRGIPQKSGQHYAFGGKAEVTFTAYSLNEEELKLIRQELENTELEQSLKLVEGMTDETLKDLQEDIKMFVDDVEKSEEEKKKEEKSKSGTNPLLALFGYYDKKDKKTSKDQKNEKIKEIKKDNWAEKEYLRKMAAAKAEDNAFNIFNVYKKAHGMANFDPSPI